MEVNGSSLKNFNFEGMTTEEIINKYESIQIRTLIQFQMLLLQQLPHR